VVAVPSTQTDADAALREADDPAMDRWLQSMLRSGSNPNVPLADGLQLQERYYLGPFHVELADIVRCCGPEPGMPFPDSEANWRPHITHLMTLIADGWLPPLLVDGATHRIMDGNHRFAALEVLEHRSCPAALMFDSPAERSAWVVAARSGTLERRFLGGHVSEEVVKIGSAVRRTAKPSTAFVSQLLTELESRGFAGAPRFLGLDGAGREALTYIPGTAFPRGQHSLDQVHAVAKLLFDLHVATRASSLSDGHPVVCHGDPKPRNTVFAYEDGPPVAFIDFDSARPGDPMEDVRYLAWMFALSSYPAPHQSVLQQRDACVAICDGYGLTRQERAQLLDGILESQQRMLSHAQSPETAEWVANELQWTRTHRRALTPA
jgi:hypothetical protein